MFNSIYIKPKRYKALPEKKVKYSNAVQLAKDINLEANDRIHCVVSGNFIFGDFIEAFFVENNIYSPKLTISTLSMSQNNIDSLANLLKGGYIGALDINISDYFFSHERRGLIPYMYKILDINNSFQLAVSMVHTKITLFETSGGKYITIHGSANLRTSQNIEQFSIEDNKELYDFHKEWIDEILKGYSTIDKTKAITEINNIKKGYQAKPVWDKIKTKF